MAYRSGELAPLSKLNALFGTSFKKEMVSGNVFDFADARNLIEHTRDYGKGIKSALLRFEAAKSDARTKILYANMKHFGQKRRAQFDRLGVVVRDYRALET